MNDLISVIVPVYKVEKYLDKCIQSIVDQTYTNLEIILIDDGSPDNCPKMCDDWAKKDSRIKVIHKENGGVSSARNEGLKNFNGEWVMFLDADDFIENITISRSIELAKKENCKIIEFSGQRLNSEYVLKANYKLPKFKGIIDRGSYVKNLFVNMNSSVCDKFYHKSMVSNIYFSTLMKNKEDMLFVAQVLLACDEIYITHERFYFYVQHENSGSSITYKKTLDYLILIDELEKIFECKHEYNKEFLSCKITSHYMIAKRLWVLGVKDEYYKQSMKFLRKNIIHVINPFFKMKKIRLKIIFVLYFKWILDLIKR